MIYLSAAAAVYEYSKHCSAIGINGYLGKPTTALLPHDYLR